MTSIATGNCGHGVAPLSARSAELAATNAPGWTTSSAVSERWESFADYMEVLRKRGVGPNVFPLVAHGALRLALAGFEDRELSTREIASARDMLRDSLAAGAVGFSTGLEYAPGISSTTEELQAIAAGALGFDALYATHCRNRSERMALAAQEAVDIARAGHMRLQMSHFVRRPYADENVVADAWAILDRARREGLSVYADVFPFDYGPTPLSVLIPPALRDRPRAEMAQCLADPDFRARIAEGLGGMFEAALANNMVDSMYVASDGADGTLVGLSIGEIARRLALPVDETAIWLLQNAGENFACVTIVENWVRWDDPVGALSDSRFLVMGDGVTATSDGAGSGFSFALADWGYAPRYLSQFVRDLKVATIEDAVYRLATDPAHQLGLKDRGTLEVGKAADIVVFELEKIGTVVAPDDLVAHPSGISEVLVNGTMVVRDGQFTDQTPGVVGVERHV